MGASLARRSSRHLIDSFAPGPIYSQRLTEVSVFLLLKDNFYRVIHLFPIAVVSLGLSVSVLTAPVTHQVLDLQKNESSSPLRPLSAFADPENLRFQAVSNRVFLQNVWLLANPWGFTAWAVKTSMT